MEIINCICNPGYANSRAVYYYKDEAGAPIEFSLDDALQTICSLAGLECFFKNGSSMFLEAYTYNLAVVPKRFRLLETMRQVTFNLHLMTNLETPVEDESEEDIRYVYAVKAHALGSYRWGCCVTSQTISYVVANEDLDMDYEMSCQAEDGVPVVLLALYQKYTCLRFTELLSIVDKKKIKRLKLLRKQLLEFQVYGTIAPANISRWHNVKQIYQHVIETNGIPEAVNDINVTLTILSEHQKEIESARNNAIISLITIFGIVSILASMLSIIQILSGGSQTEWLVTIVSMIAMICMITGVMFFREDD